MATISKNIPMLFSKFVHAKISIKKIGNFSTEESILFILNTLYAVYFKADYMKNYIRKLNLSQALENDR